MTSCATPSWPAASSRWWPGWSAIFLVLRGQTFAGHALSHVGFAGATGAVLRRHPPLWGLVVFTVAAGLGMGVLGERLSGARRGDRHRARRSRSASACCSCISTRPTRPRRRRCCSATCLASIPQTLWTLLRPRRRQPRGAGASSPGRCCSPACSPSWRRPRASRCGSSRLLFLAIVALTVAECAQIVGVLLVFTLMVGPAAAARAIDPPSAAAWRLPRCWRSPRPGPAITLAYYTDWPTSFWITALSAAVYFASLPR